MFAQPERGPRAPAITLIAIAACASCQSSAPEPTVRDPPPSVEQGGRPQTHRIIEHDHRRVVPLHVDDRIMLPDDPALDWRIELEDPSAFANLNAIDAGGEAYRVTKSGPFRVMIYGDPRCLARDGGCGLSRRRWDVTFDVR